MEGKNQLLEKLNQINEQQAISNIERIISSYRHTWDIFTELIQNSADAIIEQFEFENIEKGKINLSVDNENRKIIIEDNGCGIEESNLSNILVTGESLKRKGNTGRYGFMGFGLTFIAFQSSFFKIESNKNKLKSSRTYLNLYEFIYCNKPLQTSIEEKNNELAQKTNDENGTKITIEFPLNFPEESIEANLKTAFEYTAKAKLFETILRTRTAVGLLETIFDDRKNFEFNLKINGSSIEIKNTFLTTREAIEELFPEEKRIYDINDDYQNIIDISDHLPDQAKNKTREAILLDSKIEDVEIGMLNRLNVRFYIAGTSKNYINRFNEEISGENLNEFDNGFEFSNGIWLAINGLPTGVCLEVFEHGNYLPYTVIVDVVNNAFRKELDAGRKGITERRANQIRVKVRELLKEYNFIEYRKHIIGTKTRITNPLYDPKQSLIDKLNTKKFFRDLDLNFKYFPPQEEQEVITLFTSLCSVDIIKGYYEKVISSSEVYDGLYDYKIFEDKETLHTTNNLLGIDRGVFLQYSNPLKKDNVVIEYKLFLHQIISDANSGIKDLNQIDLIICWEIDKEKISSWGSVVQGKPVTSNIYYGVTHVLGTTQRQDLPVIELKTVIEKFFNINV